MWRAPNCAQNVNAYLPHQLGHCAVCCFPEKSSGSEIITEAAKHTPAVSICKCVFVSNEYSGTGKKINRNRSWAIIRLCWRFQGAFPRHVDPEQSSFGWEFPHLLWLLSIFQTFFNWPVGGVTPWRSSPSDNTGKATLATRGKAKRLLPDASVSAWSVLGQRANRFLV